MTESLEQAFAAAMQAVEQGRLPQAAQMLRDITKNWPDCKEAWYQRAELSQRQGRLTEAVDLYGRVLELDPNIQEVYLNLGLMAARQQQAELAVTYWRQALSINPDYHEARLHLGLLLARMGQAEQALNELVESLKRAPDTAPLLLIQAREQLQRGMYPECSLLCQALRQGSDIELARVLLIELQALHELGLDTEARELLAELPSGLEQPWAEPLRSLYVSAHYADPDAFKAAQAELDQALAHDPGTVNLPVGLLADLPRLRGWRLLERAEAVDAWLGRVYGQTAAGAFGPVRLQPGERHRLVWLLDNNTLPWQEACWRQLAALTSRSWQLHLLLRQESMAWLLNAPELRSLVQISVLPPELDAAANVIRQLKPHLLLFGDVAGDSLQFWLSRQRLAHLQVAWSSRAQDFRLLEQGCLDAEAPLYLMDFDASQTEPADTLIFGLPAEGWRPEDLTWLSGFDPARLQLLATPDGLGALQQLIRALEGEQSETQVKAGLWRSPQELAVYFEHAAALLQPSQGGELYTQAAAAVGLPRIAAGSPLPESLGRQPDAAWQNWRNHLPATGWAVSLQDLTTRALRGEL